MTYIVYEIPDLQRVKAAFEQAPAKVKEELSRAATKAGVVVQRAARQEAPRRTSRLANSIMLELEAFGARVGPRGVSYAVYVHEGTGPHLIYPKRAKALHWDTHFAKVVHHPGTKPNPFMARAAEETEPEVLRIFEEALDNII